MDDSDRIESREPLVAVPERLVFAMQEWVSEAIRNICDRYAADVDRDRLVQAVLDYEALRTGTLTATRTAELAHRAADWLWPLWPKEVAEVAEIERLLEVTRGLLELRDRAIAIARERGEPEPDLTIDDGSYYHLDPTHLVVLEPRLVEILRSQSLRVLEFNHQPFEEIGDLPAVERMSTVSVFREAFQVLDTIGWLAIENPASVTVPIMPGHAAQLDRLRKDLERAIGDRLEVRRSLTDPDEVAEVDHQIRADRETVAGLQQILGARHTGVERWTDL